MCECDESHQARLTYSVPCPHHPAYSSVDLPGLGADAKVKYVLATWPVVDHYERYKYAKETQKTRLVELSEGYFLSTEAMKNANPFRILQRGEKSHLPSTLVVQGTADENLPVPVTEQFVAAYELAGGIIALEMFTGMAHGFGSNPGPETDRTVELMKKYVSRCLSGPV